MGSRQLCHDCAWACAIAIVESLENCLRPEERTDALHAPRGAGGDKAMPEAVEELIERLALNSEMGAVSQFIDRDYS